MATSVQKWGVGIMLGATILGILNDVSGNYAIALILIFVGLPIGIIMLVSGGSKPVSPPQQPPIPLQPGHYTPVSVSPIQPYLTSPVHVNALPHVSQPLSSTMSDPLSFLPQQANALPASVQQAEETVALGRKRETNELVSLTQADRRRGLYVIGKNGTGKTTFLVNLMLQDIEAGRGLCFIDPHGIMALGIWFIRSFRAKRPRMTQNRGRDVATSQSCRDCTSCA